MIASLSGITAFRYLVEDMQEGLDDLISRLAEARSDQETLDTARLFQAAWRLTRHLKERPEHLRAELDREAQEAQAASFV